MSALAPVAIGSNIRLSILALDGTDVPDEAGVTVQWVSIYINGSRNTALTYTTETPSTGCTDIIISTTGRTDGDEIKVVAGFSYGGAEYDATSRWHVRALERGTNSAFLAASAPANFSALGINASGHVSRVTLTDANTDMRGTDNALLAASVPANFSDLAIAAATGAITVGTNLDKTSYTIDGTITNLTDLRKSVVNGIRYGSDAAV